MPKIKWMPNDYILKKSPDVPWLKWFQILWNDFEWPIVILLSIISLVLGTFGFFIYNEEKFLTLTSFSNALYQSLQLFSMQVSFEVTKPIQLPLQIARFLSPGLAAYALSQAFLEIFKKQIELFRLVRSENHVVLCGLGEKGLLLVKDLRKANHPVVIIEQEGNNPYLELCRELGAIVIIGDATDNKVLLKAGLRQAKRLIVVCGDDGVNVQVADQAQKLLTGGKRKETLICNINIVDKYLKIVLKQKELTTKDLSAFRLEMFNIYDVGARILLGNTFKTNDIKPPHLLVIGLGDLGESIVVNAARTWCLNNTMAKQKLDISVIDRDVARNVGMLKNHFPLLEDVCQFHLQEYQSNLAEYKQALFPSENQKSPITNVYVCHDDNLLGLHDGFHLLQLLNHQKVQILIRLNEDSGLANILSETISPDLENLKAFGLLDHTCRIDLLEDSSQIARVIHEDYFGRETKKGITSEQNPNIVPWDHLTNGSKESNRRQADHIGVKLKEVGYGMEPWREYGKEKLIFKEGEIIIMAKMEHKRWWDERLWEGWKYAPKRDDARKLHPDLIEWEKLTPVAREKDVAAVKLIPTLLARAGFQIYRLE